MRRKHNHLDRSLQLATPSQWISATESVIIQRSRRKDNVNVRSRSETVEVIAEVLLQLPWAVLRYLRKKRAEAKRDQADQDAT